MSDGQIDIRKEGPLAWLIINRPEKRNAFSGGMWAAVPEQLKELEADPGVRALLGNDPRYLELLTRMGLE